MRCYAAWLLTGFLVCTPGAAEEGNETGWRIGPKARLFLDYAEYDSDLRRLKSGTNIGSARIGLAGSYTRSIRFNVEYELKDRLNTGAPVALRYAELEFALPSSMYLLVGQTDEPFGLEAYTSNRRTTFIDRSLAFAFIPFYHLGTIIGFSTDQGGVALGVFNKTVGPGEFASERAVTARALYSPIKSQATLWHVGLAISRRHPPLDTVRFSSRPESSVTDQRLVDTARIGFVERHDQIGLESLAIAGPFSLQGEYFASRLDRKGNREHLQFRGSYLQVSVFPTGESRSFHSGRGYLNDVYPSSGQGGAWELAARVSTLRLDDGEVHGGNQRNWTIGVNYYVDKNTRIMLNAITARSSRNGVKDNPNIITLRLQTGF